MSTRPENWSTRIQEYRSSGMLLKDYCEKHDIQYSKMLGQLAWYGRNKKLQRDPLFIPAKIQSPPLPERGAEHNLTFTVTIMRFSISSENDMIGAASLLRSIMAEK